MDHWLPRCGYSSLLSPCWTAGIQTLCWASWDSLNEQNRHSDVYDTRIFVDQHPCLCIQCSVSLFLSCVCVLDTRTCVRAHLHVCTLAILGLPFIFRSRVSHSNLELTRYSSSRWPGWPGASLSSEVGVMSRKKTHPAFMWVLRIQTLVLLPV